MSLNATQVKALAALLTSKSIAAAAKKAGVDERTLRRWLADADFVEAYTKELRGVMQVVAGRLKSASMHALDALEGVLRDKKARPGERIAAASKILDLATRAHELELKRADASGEGEEFEDMSSDDMRKAVGE